MSDYAQITDFSDKDALATGNPLKLIRGTDFDAELEAISVAIATKYDSADLASQAQAEAESSLLVLMTPGRVAQWADYNAGIVGDLQALADPGADRILGWDESANAAIGFSLGGALSTSNTTLQVTAADILTQLLTVDGAGSGLDADLLDGNSSAIFAKLADSNVFTGASQTVTANGALVHVNSQNTSGGWLQWSTSNTVRGYFGNGSLITGGSPTVSDIGIRAVSGGLFFSGDNGTTAHLKISSSGVVTTPDASAAEVGFKGIGGGRGVSSSDSTAATDAGKVVIFTGGSGQTFTLDNDPPTNSIIFLLNEGGTNWTIAASGTLTFAGATGNRTLATGCIACAYRRDTGNWYISGQLS